jgi:hypothetical protein
VKTDKNLPKDVGLPITRSKSPFSEVDSIGDEDIMIGYFGKSGLHPSHYPEHGLQ